MPAARSQLNILFNIEKIYRRNAVRRLLEPQIEGHFSSRNPVFITNVYAAHGTSFAVHTCARARARFSVRSRVSIL